MVWSHSDQWMLTADHGGFVKYWQSNMNNVKMYQAHKEAIRGLRLGLVATSCDIKSHHIIAQVFLCFSIKLATKSCIGMVLMLCLIYSNICCCHVVYVLFYQYAYIFIYLYYYSVDFYILINSQPCLTIASHSENSITCTVCTISQL